MCLAATVLAIWPHAVQLGHAGALWRDEAGGVREATLPDFGETWRMLPQASFPALFPMLVRIWSAAGLGASDFNLRILGFLIGLCLLGALWLNARLMGYRLPVISLGLLAANPAVILWGDSLRAYGCGCVFIVLTLGLIWRLVRAPCRTSLLLAAAAAVLSVQTLYQNAVLVLAACIAGCAVCARHRDWKTAAMVLGVGLAASVSLVPYVPSIIESQHWLLVDKVGFETGRDFAIFASVLGSPPVWLLWGWLGLVLMVLGMGWKAMREKVLAPEIGREDLPLYSSLVLIAGAAGYYGFLRLAGRVAQPWYFPPLLVCAAAAMDAALATGGRLNRVGPLILASATFCVLFPVALREASWRLTNIDLLAAEVEKRAEPGDYIVVYPCHFGITFERYYKGQIPWTTVPEIADHRFHRLDLLKEKMGETSPIQPVLDRAAQTLASGRSLWILGGLPPHPAADDISPPDPPPAPIPNNPLGWWEGYYMDAWGRQLEHLIGAHAEHVYVLPEDPAIPIHPYEKLPLYMVTGWRAEPRAPGASP
jgi:hypothetical protein